MADRTAIEWVQGPDGARGSTWNPVTGCDRVSAGCDHCYAEAIATRFAGTPAFPHGFAVTLHPDRLTQPTRWRKPRTVFVNSMSDLFHHQVPDGFIHQVWQAMAGSDRHTFQVLTKRPHRMATLASRYNQHRTADGTIEPLPNVWLGASVETDRYTYRADHLRDTPAAVRFLSCEPLLGPLPSLDLAGIGWVIIGGESGRGARPMELRWAEAIVDRCRAAGVPVFVKQLGSRWGADHKDLDRFPEGLQVREMPEPARA